MKRINHINSGSKFIPSFTSVFESLEEGVAHIDLWISKAEQDAIRKSGNGWVSLGSALGHFVIERVSEQCWLFHKMDDCDAFRQIRGFVTDEVPTACDMSA